MLCLKCLTRQQNPVDIQDCVHTNHSPNFKLEYQEILCHIKCLAWNLINTLPGVGIELVPFVSASSEVYLDIVLTNGGLQECSQVCITISARHCSLIVNSVYSHWNLEMSSTLTPACKLCAGL